MHRPTRTTAIHGTWGWTGLRTRGQWWQPGSWWWQQMARYGCEPICPEMFAWSGDVNGMPWLRGRRYTDWEIGAFHFTHFFEPPIITLDDRRRLYIPIEERNVVAHSFGGNLPIIACAELGLQIHRLITVGTPVRPDMEAYAVKALPNILGGWVHLHAKGGWFADRMQARGELFDGRWGIQRDFKIPGVQNYAVPGINHSKVLHEAEAFQKGLVDTGILDWFTAEVAAV